MFAITRGPSMKPACAATKRSSASDSSVMKTNHWPTGRLAMRTFPASFAASSEFIVWLSSTKRTSRSR